MLKTRFTELVGCTVPVQSAPITTWPQLALAVAQAGGLGTVCVNTWTRDQIPSTFDDMRKQTTGVFGANFLGVWEPKVLEERVAVAASKAKVIDFFYSDPNPRVVEIVHANGALASWQVGSLEEARAAVDAGCDFIIAQGIQAGGHVRGTLGVLTLLNQVLEAVNVPVLAAGGIGTARALAAVLAAGADGVRIGTRFVAAKETNAHPEYVKAVIAAHAEDTVYSEAFSTDWKDAPHRVLRSSIEAASAFEGDVVGEGLQYNGEHFPILRFSTLMVTADTTGEIKAMPFWAGESVDVIKGVQSAAEIIQELADGAEQLLRRW